MISIPGLCYSSPTTTNHPAYPKSSIYEDPRKFPAEKIIDSHEKTRAAMPTALIKCNICLSSESKYVCPRCNVRYCSMGCYRHRIHEVCTENFYRDQVLSEIKLRSIEVQENHNGKMRDIMQRSETEPSLAETIPLAADFEMDLSSRLADIDLDTASFEDIWSRLVPKERATFEKQLQLDLMGDEPSISSFWWTLDESDFYRDEIPQRTHNLDLDKVHQSLFVNFVDILGSYVVAMRATEGELTKSGKDNVGRYAHLVWSLSSVLNPPQPGAEPFTFYGSVEEATATLWNKVLIQQYDNPFVKMLLKTHYFQSEFVDDLIAISRTSRSIYRVLADFSVLMERTMDSHGLTSLTMRGAQITMKKLQFYQEYIVRLDERLKLPQLFDKINSNLTEKREMLRREKTMHEDLCRLMNKQRQSHILSGKAKPTSKITEL